MSKQLIIFDIDNTLTESRENIADSTATLLSKLSNLYYVGILSGENLQGCINRVILPALNKGVRQEQIYVLPASGAEMYQYVNKNYISVYKELLSENQKEHIISILEATLQASRATMNIEDKGSQISYSGLPKDAKLEEKTKWDPSHEKRKNIIALLQPLLPDFELYSGGTTSIDITKKQINKAYGIRKLCEFIKVPLADVTYVGDALYEGGNDEVVKSLPVHVLRTRSIKETETIIQNFISA